MQESEAGGEVATSPSSSGISHQPREDEFGCGTIDELNGGTFGLTTPPLLPLIGALLGVVFGVIYLSEGGVIAIILAALLLAVFSRSPLELKLAEIRQRLAGREVHLTQKEAGVHLVNFWNAATVEKSGVTDRDWIFPPPARSEWSEGLYEADKSGELIAEHPNKIGTPSPPTLSNYGLFSSIAFAVSVVAALTQGAQFESGGGIKLAYIFIAASTLWLLVSIFAWKRGQAMQDTPTSNIRSMAVGPLELVGQARPWVTPPPVVVVDRDASKSVADLNAWNWTYEVYRCRKVTTTDSKGRTQTKTVCNWEHVRGDSGGHPFVLHDGSGGVVARPETFSRRDLGGHIARWECAHSLQARDLLWRLTSSGDVRRHRWTLWGLRMLEPCYLLGNAKSKSAESLAREGDVDKGLQNALLEVVGEDAPGFRARLVKGSELALLDGMKSEFELLVIPTLALFVSILLL